MGMQCDLAGLLTNAARLIDTLAADVRAYAKEAGDFEEGDEDGAHDPCPTADYHAFALREASSNAIKTYLGRHTVTEFAECYGLAAGPPQAVLTETDYPLE